MTRIAFCDDDAALLHQMQDFLEQYRTLRVSYRRISRAALMPPGRSAGMTRRCRSSL